LLEQHSHGERTTGTSGTTGSTDTTGTTGTTGTSGTTGSTCNWAYWYYRDIWNNRENWYYGCLEALEQQEVQVQLAHPQQLEICIHGMLEFGVVHVQYLLKNAKIPNTIKLEKPLMNGEG
jgi:hypothetical protein